MKTRSGCNVSSGFVKKIMNRFFVAVLCLSAPVAAHAFSFGEPNTLSNVLKVASLVGGALGAQPAHNFKQSDESLGRVSGSMLRDLPYPQITGGWSNDMQMSAQENCLINQTIGPCGDSVGFIGLGMSITHADIENMLNVFSSLGCKVPWYFSADLSAKFSSDIKVDGYSLAFYFADFAQLP